MECSAVGWAVQGGSSMTKQPRCEWRNAPQTFATDVQYSSLLTVWPKKRKLLKSNQSTNFLTFFQVVHVILQDVNFWPFIYLLLFEVIENASFYVSDVL